MTSNEEYIVVLRVTTSCSLVIGNRLPDFSVPQTERVSVAVTIWTHSGDAWFKSRPGYRLPGFRAFMGFLGPTRQIQ
jgi:hypothetical protein